MNRRQFAMLTVVASAFAFAGGLLSGIATGAAPAVAQTGETIVAKELRIVDSNGVVRAVIATYNNGLITGLDLNDRTGMSRVKFLVDGNGNPSAHFWDRMGGGVFTPASTPSINFWGAENQLIARLPH